MKTVRELIQGDCTPEAIRSELELLLHDDLRRARIQADYAELRARMKNPGAASRLASGIIQSVLNR